MQAEVLGLDGQEVESGRKALTCLRAGPSSAGIPLGSGAI